jgi:hypothetical protein
MSDIAKDNLGKYPFHYLRRLKDGVILDVPNKTLEQTMKGGGFEYISGFGYAKEVRVFEGKTVDVPVVDDQMECPICGFVSKTEKALLLHKKQSHS